MSNQPAESLLTVMVFVLISANEEKKIKVRKICFFCENVKCHSKILEWSERPSAWKIVTFLIEIFSVVSELSME